MWATVLQGTLVYMDDLRFPVRAEFQRRHCDKKDFGDNRLAALARDGYCCVSCGMTNAEHQERWGCTITIDHIDGQGFGHPNPNNDLDNLQTLCLPCHGRKDGARADRSEQVWASGEAHPRAKLTVDLVAQMRRDRRAGATYPQLAEKYGVVTTVAYNACIGRSWKSVNATEPPVAGDHQGFTYTGATHKDAKLNPDKVRAMRAERAQGWTYQQLVTKYGVTLNAVAQVCTGKTWKSVPMKE